MMQISEQSNMTATAKVYSSKFKKVMTFQAPKEAVDEFARQRKVFNNQVNKDLIRTPIMYGAGFFLFDRLFDSLIVRTKTPVKSSALWSIGAAGVGLLGVLYSKNKAEKVMNQRFIDEYCPSVSPKFKKS